MTAGLEESVMLMLAEAAEDNIGQLGPGEMAERFRPPVPFRKVEIAADHLVQLGHAKPIEYDHAMTEYRATQKGLDWVEKNFRREDQENGNRSWVRLENAEKTLEKTAELSPGPQGLQIVNNFSPSNTITSPPQQQRNSISWSGWVGVAVAIVALVVSLWLGGKL